MNKSFDCVEMKRQAQQKLRDEFEAHRGEFATFIDFIRAKADESEWVRRQKEKLGSRRKSS